MNYTPQNPRPVPFDLGNINAVKVGDEVTTLDDKGHPGASVFLVYETTPDRVHVRRTDGKTHGVWWTKNGGGCPWAMHDQNVMRYYYSVNPKHIKRAKANARAAAIAEEAKKAAFAAQLALAKPIGEALGDGWDSDSDEGSYYRGSAAHELAEKLTPEQMATLAGWLGLGK